MAYFQQQPSGGNSYTRQFAPVQEKVPGQPWDEEEDYDDGFDELMEEEPDEAPSREEIQRERQRKFRIAAGIGDLAATLIGVGVILALVAFLISIIQFVSTDFSQNFSLLQTKF